MSKPPVNVLSESNVNHLRRLLGYVRCEMAGQSPDEYVETMRQIAPYVGQIDEAAQQRVMAGYRKAKAVPKYVRDAIKALESVVRETP